jgi:glycerol-3-phosphate acyltransferase PlsY
MLPLLLVAAAYVIGSIPFSYLVVRMMAGADIRKVGSRNVGATNVARSFGKLAGVIALFFDVAKGYATVLLAESLTRRPEWPLASGSDASPWHSQAFWVALAVFVAMLGHMFPVWLRFHGGKGVATATGAFLALDPLSVAAALIVFLIVLLTTRFVSLSSITSAASIPIFLRFLSHAPFWTVVISILISLSIILKHRSNVARIVNGTERRVGDAKERQS